MASKISPQEALIYVMVIMSAADSNMTDQELFTMGEITRTLPAFRDFESDLLIETAEKCVPLLSGDNGLGDVIAAVRGALTPNLRETAYALACDIAVADGHLEQEEIRLLEIIRDNLDIDRLSAAAIERGARARFQPL